MPTTIESGKIKLGCCGFIVLSIIAGIVLLALSFRGVDEGELCLLYDSESRVVQQEVYSTPGKSFVGPTKRFMCWPKSMLVIEFGQNGNPMLNVRTLEGLLIQISVSIQYRLLAAELYELHTEVGRNYEDLLLLEARSTLRNIASNFGATEYITANKADIARNMSAELDKTFARRHCTVVSLLLNSVTLPGQWNKVIETQRQTGLEVKISERNGSLAVDEARQRRETEMIKLDGQRGVALADKAIALNQANFENVTAVNQALNRRKKAILDVESARQTIIINTQTKVYEAESARIGDITLKETQRDALAIQWDIEKLEAQSKAAVQVREGQAKAENYLIEGLAEVEGERLALSATKNALAKLKSEMGLNSTEILLYMWVRSLRENKAASIAMDIYTPETLLLPGQKEAYERMNN